MAVTAAHLRSCAQVLNRRAKNSLRHAEDCRTLRGKGRCDAARELDRRLLEAAAGALAGEVVAVERGVKRRRVHVAGHTSRYLDTQRR